MSCCGQKCFQLQQAFQTQNQYQHIQKPDLQNPVGVKYLGKKSFLVKGKQSGFFYLFAEGEMNLMVDERDIQQLLEDTKRFSPAKEISMSLN